MSFSELLNTDYLAKVSAKFEHMFESRERMQLRCLPILSQHSQYFTLF